MWKLFLTFKYFDMRFLLFLLLCPLFAFAQKQHFVEHYANGQLKSEGDYIRGLEHGAWSYFYRNGKLMQKTNYYLGEFDGQVLQYHENGELKHEGYFKRDKQDSIFKTFSAEGQLLEEGIYALDLKMGEWNYFHLDGSLYLKEQYDSTQVKTLYLADADGKVWISEGKGEMREFFSDGELKSSCNYENGLRNGDFQR